MPDVQRMSVAAGSKLRVESGVAGEGRAGAAYHQAHVNKRCTHMHTCTQMHTNTRTRTHTHTHAVCAAHLLAWVVTMIGAHHVASAMELVDATPHLVMQ